MAGMWHVDVCMQASKGVCTLTLAGVPFKAWMERDVASMETLVKSKRGTAKVETARRTTTCGSVGHTKRRNQVQRQDEWRRYYSTTMYPPSSLLGFTDAEERRSAQKTTAGVV